MQKITIATRGSALALWQANHIRSLISQFYPALQTELLIIKTQGDRITDVPLARIGGKGLFVKEIEEALLDGRADIAVHSMKDVPMYLPDGLVLGAILKREVCTDVFVSEKYASLQSLPQQAVVGTCSLRRQAQILNFRPDLSISVVRGNVETRMRKMQEGLFDAIILASAGLKRLNIRARYMQELFCPHFIPAVGQGALGIELKKDRDDLMKIVSALSHRETEICVLAERAFLRELEGGCQVPIAGHAMIKNDMIFMQAMVSDTAGKHILRQEGTCIIAPENANDLGLMLAQKLILQGAKDLLETASL